MRKFFVDKIDNSVVLSGDDHKHISKVLRAKKGGNIVLCDGYYDGIYEISDIKKDATYLSLIEKHENVSETAITVDLYFCALKGGKNDFVVQKCTELGVKNFIPVISEFVQESAKSVHTERLSRIAEEAAKQCGRGAVPTVHASVTLDSACESLKNYDAVVFPYEDEKGTDIKSFLRSLADVKNIAVLIGSEGGFSRAEVEKLTREGITAVTLGNRILRAETACITAAALIMYEKGEMRNL